MKYLRGKWRFLFAVFSLTIICCIFFYKTVLHGLIPFPGDLLVSGYGPWRHFSYDGYVAGAVPSKDQYFDVIRELYPWKTLVINQIKQFTLPLWNPYNFSGAPLLANYQSQVFYPLSVLYLIFPQPVAWTILVIIQPLLGSVFAFLFASEIGLSMAASLLVAVIFNFSSFANVWMEFTTVWHTILWLPLLLFLVERGIRQKTLYGWQKLLFVFALFSSITAGHPQDFINTFLFFCLYTLIRTITAMNLEKHEKTRFFFTSLFPVLVLPFLLALPQLLPTIELFSHSARVPHDYKLILSTMLIQWWQLPMVLIQDFFGNPATKSSVTGDYVMKVCSVGVVGFSLALAAVTGKIKNWHTAFFGITAGVMLLITVSSPITAFLYRYPIPIMSTGSPTRILFLLMFALSVLAGFGFDRIKKQQRLPIRSVATVAVVFAILWIFVLTHPTVPFFQFIPAHFATMKRAIMIASVIFIAFVGITMFSTVYKKIALYLLLPLCIAELFLSFYKFNPFVPKTFVYPENPVFSFLQKNAGIDRFWGYGTASVEANFATQEFVYSPDGTDPLNLKWYNEFIQSSADGNLARTFTRKTRSDAQLAPGYGEKDLPTNAERLRVMDVLGIKYVIDRSENPKDNETFATSRFKPVWHEYDWTIYENLLASPRFYLTDDVRYYEAKEDFEKQFFADSFIPGKTVLLNSSSTVQTIFKSSNADTVRLIHYTPNRIEFETTTSNPTFLFLSDTYDTGWTATVNGQKQTVYQSNYAFRGVVVPEGTSSIILEYRPTSVIIGLFISAATGIVCLGYLLFKLVRKNA